jgi:hypothetical protein
MAHLARGIGDTRDYDDNDLSVDAETSP